MECKADDVERYKALRTELSKAYAHLYVLLTWLPVPLLVVRRQSADPVGAARALSRAWNLIGVEETGEDVKEHLRTAITDWLVAFELAGVVEYAGGPYPWRVDGIEAALARFSAAAEAAAAGLEELPAPAGPGLRVNPEG